MSRAAADHNELSREWVMKVAGVTNSSAELMVVVESALLGGMLVLQSMYGMKPAACSEMMEHAIQRATERFVEVGK